MIAASEYELLTEAAGLVERSERAKFVVRGGEAVDFLQGQVSNDVESLAPGTGCYATILNHKGKLRTDLRILRGEDFVWLDTEAIGHAVLRHMLDTYTLGRDVQWEDLTENHAILSLIGPAADDLAPDAPPRTEHSFVNSEKGCYVGQETVARLHWMGKANRHLRGLRLSEPVERRTDIVLGEKVVGRVSSTCVSPRLGPIALALVRREAAPGDTVRVGAAEAEVVELPFERG